MQHIHVNWRGNSPTARGNSPWGVASITHIVCDRHRRRRGAGLLLASLAQPRPKILTPKSLPGSMRATTPSVVIWAPVTPSARDSSSKDGASARAVGSLGRYDYWGTLFGGGSDLSTTFDGEASNGATLLGYQVHTPAITPIR